MGDNIIENLYLKIDEAKYHLGEMIVKEETRNQKDFNHVLSAYITAARSVLQFAEKYCNRYYQANINSVKLKEYFKNLRDGNIHEKMITTITSGSSEVLSSITVSGEIDTSDINNEVSTSSPTNKYYYTTGETSDEYGTDSIVELGKQYIKEIENFIDNYRSSIS